MSDSKYSRMQPGELKEILGGGVLMLGVTRHPDSSKTQSEQPPSQPSSSKPQSDQLPRSTPQSNANSNPSTPSL